MNPSTYPPFLAIEPLEARIAPASVTFTDVDGQIATVVSSLGSASALENALVLAAEGSGFRLQKLDLAGEPAFEGAKIKILKGTRDDAAVVDVGYIDATGIDLGKVTVDGDLGQIDAGNTDSKTMALAKLNVGSMGVVAGTQGTVPGAGPDSRILGRLGKLTVAGDYQDAMISVLGIDPDPDPDQSTARDSRGDIGNVNIGGHLLGGDAVRSGSIYAKGDIGNIHVSGNIRGGQGDDSGSITSERKMGTVTIDGNIEGGILSGPGTSDRAGRIFSGDVMGSVTIGGYLKGGDGLESGNISSATGLGTVTISGAIADGADQVSVLGGAGERSGAIGTGGEIGKILVEHSIKGGAGRTSGAILSIGPMASVTIMEDVIGGSEEESGAIGSSDTVGNVKVLGDLRGGTGPRSGVIVSSKTIRSVEITGSVIGGTMFESGAIGSIEPLGPVTIGGDLKGGDGDRSGAVLGQEGVTSVQISGSILGAKGFASGSVTSDFAIGTVTVTGNVVGGEGTLSGSVVTLGEVGKLTRGVKLPALATAPGSAAADIGQITIGGRLEGGAGSSSGQIFSAGDLQGVSVGAILGGNGTATAAGSIYSILDMGPIVVNGSVTGGSAEGSGQISSGGDIARVTINGDLVGGSGAYAKTGSGLGQVSAAGAIGPVNITGLVRGGGGDYSAAIRGASIASVNIGGDLEANGAASASLIAESGDLGPIVIGGEVRTALTELDSGGRPFLPMQISAAGTIASIDAGAFRGMDLAPLFVTAGDSIADIVVRDSTAYTRILAGYNPALQPVNGNSTIGSVVIGTTGAGGWTATDLVAGATTGSAQKDDFVFGTPDDAAIPVSTGQPSSVIGSVVIKGDVLATQDDTDHFGIVAGRVDAVSVAGVPVALTAGAGNDQVDVGGGAGLPTDLTVNERLV